MIYAGPAGGSRRFYGYGQDVASTSPVPPPTKGDSKSEHLAVIGTAVGILSFFAFMAVHLAGTSRS